MRLAWDIFRGKVSYLVCTESLTLVNGMLGIHWHDIEFSVVYWLIVLGICAIMGIIAQIRGRK